MVDVLIVVIFGLMGSIGALVCRLIDVSNSRDFYQMKSQSQDKEIKKLAAEVRYQLIKRTAAESRYATLAASEPNAQLHRKMYDSQGLLFEGVEEEPIESHQPVGETTQP